MAENTQNPAQTPPPATSAPAAKPLTDIVGQFTYDPKRTWEQWYNNWDGIGGISKEAWATGATVASVVVPGGLALRAATTAGRLIYGGMAAGAAVTATNGTVPAFMKAQDDAAKNNVELAEQDYDGTKIALIKFAGGIIGFNPKQLVIDVAGKTVSGGAFVDPKTNTTVPLTVVLDKDNRPTSVKVNGVERPEFQNLLPAISQQILRAQELQKALSAPAPAAAQPATPVAATPAQPSAPAAPVAQDPATIPPAVAASTIVAPKEADVTVRFDTPAAATAPAAAQQVTFDASKATLDAKNALVITNVSATLPDGKTTVVGTLTADQQNPTAEAVFTAPNPATPGQVLTAGVPRQQYNALHNELYLNQTFGKSAGNKDGSFIDELAPILQDNSVSQAEFDSVKAMLAENFTVPANVTFDASQQAGVVSLMNMLKAAAPKTATPPAPGRT